MPPYDDWNRLDDEEDDELQDFSVSLARRVQSQLTRTQQLESRKDVILFCIDCSPTMHELREDPAYEDVQTCHLFAALEAAMQIQKKKVVVGPNDSIGILLFNTVGHSPCPTPSFFNPVKTRQANTNRGQGSEIKKNTYLYQPIGPIDAPTIKNLMRLLESARENPGKLREEFPPLEGKRVATGDVFTSCNWVLRDGFVAHMALSAHLILVKGHRKLRLSVCFWSRMKTIPIQGLATSS